MAEIPLQARCRSDRIAQRLTDAGVQALVRSSGGEATAAGHVATSHVIVVPDEQLAAAQGVLNAFDPVAAQAEVEAEEAVERDNEAFKKLAKGYALEIIRHIKNIESKASITLPWNLPQ